MAGRRVENQRRQKYGTSSYVSGNTARKLAAAPQRRYEEYDIPGNYEISEIKALSTLKELVQQEIYKDFDFTNVWKISKYYPVVKNLDFDESLLEKPNVHEHSYDILNYYYYNICNMLTISECPVTGQDKLNSSYKASVRT